MAGLHVLTATEAARVVSRLTASRCTPRRVRHLLVHCGLGTELPVRQRGETRLYGALDLAVLRLAIELEKQGVSSWVSRVVITYARRELVLAWKAGSNVGLAVVGLRGMVEPALKARPGGTIAWVPLRDVWRGIDAEISKIRADVPDVWMWRRVPVHAVRRSTV